MRHIYRLFVRSFLFWCLSVHLPLNTHLRKSSTGEGSLWIISCGKCVRDQVLSVCSVDSIFLTIQITRPLVFYEMLSSAGSIIVEKGTSLTRLSVSEAGLRQQDPFSQVPEREQQLLSRREAVFCSLSLQQRLVCWRISWWFF